MDKLKLTGQNLGRVFNFRRAHFGLYHAVILITKTAKLKVEISAQTAFRFSPVNYRTPRYISQFQVFHAKWVSVIEMTRF